MAERTLTPTEIMAMLAGAPPRIADLTRGLSAAALGSPPAPSEWSAVEVLAHLRACADVWGGCIGRILAEDRPTIRAMNPRTWIERTDYRELAFGPSFQTYALQRRELVALLESLAPEQWQRAGTVTGAGKTLERTVHFYAQWLATHERPHVKQIGRIVEQMGASAAAAGTTNDGHE